MQALIVYLIVAVAAGYAAWLFMPRALRRWLITRLIIIMPSRREWLSRLEAGNEGCSTCKGCAPGAKESSSSKDPNAPSRDVNKEV